MSRSFSILGLMVAMLLGSCVTMPRGTGFAWSYQNQPGEGPKLAYGAPASDNVVLMMTCEPGASRVNVLLMGGSPRDGIQLVSGDASARLAADPAAPAGMGQMIEGAAHPRAAPLARFARTGLLTLVDRGRPVKVDASPLERPGVQQFFEACQA
jgi:hypothetical protein